MSVWTSVQGVVEIPLLMHYSLRKGIEQINWETSRLVIHEEARSASSVTYRLSFSFCDDGISAAQGIRDWLDAFPSGSRVDITTEVRWLR